MYKRTTINESVQPRFLDIEEFMTYTSLGRTSAMRLPEGQQSMNGGNEDGK